jgi:hypothetical protein
MDPEPSAAAARHVHFPTLPTYIDYDVPIPGPSSSPERPRPPRSVPRRPRAVSESEVSERRVSEDDADTDDDGHDAVPSGPSWKEKGKQRAVRDVFLESEASSPPRPSNSAREGEADVSCAGREPHCADTSGEIRVRGKERELSAVREERRAREQRWEIEAETTLIREEKSEYEDKIKQLEEEVQRLRAEVRICSLGPRSSPSLPIACRPLFFKSWRNGPLQKNPQTTRIRNSCPHLRPHRHRRRHH